MSEPKSALLDLDDDEDIFGPPASNNNITTHDEMIEPKDPLQTKTQPKLELDEEDLFASSMEVQDEINLNDDESDILPIPLESNNKLELNEISVEEHGDDNVTTPIPDTPPLLSTSRDEDEHSDVKNNGLFDLSSTPQSEDSDTVPVKATAPSIEPTPIVNPTASMSTKPKIEPRNLDKPRKSQNDEVLDDPIYDIQICISGYEKRGEGMNAFTAFTISVKTSNVPGFTKHDYSVPRRFSDFLGLHEKLAEKYTHAGRIIPVPPGKSLVGMTKTKMSKGEEDPAASEFLEKRRASLERFIRRVVLHPVLIQDPDVRDFLTLETELPKATSTSAISGAGIRRMVKGFGEAVNKIAYHMEETDTWFEEKQAEIEDLDEAMKKLHSSFESLATMRKDLGGSTEGFCRAMQLLAACEENTALSRAFSQLAETEEKVGLCQADQADKDFFIMAENLKDYIALIAAVKEVFYERVKVWNKWQDAQKLLTAKREAKTRFELQGKTDKLPNAKREVSETEEKVQECEEDFEKISKMIRKEVKRFDIQRIKDMKLSLLQYLNALALTQQQLVKYWEAFLPEAKQIIV